MFSEYLIGTFNQSKDVPYMKAATRKIVVSTDNKEKKTVKFID